MYIFLTDYIPNKETKLAHFAAYNAYKRVLYAGFGDLTVLESRDWEMKKHANRVMGQLRLGRIKEVCLLMEGRA